MLGEFGKWRGRGFGGECDRVFMVWDSRWFVFFLCVVWRGWMRHQLMGRIRVCVFELCRGVVCMMGERDVVDSDW